MKNMRLFFISVIACFITSCAMQQGVRGSNYSDMKDNSTVLSSEEKQKVHTENSEVTDGFKKEDINAVLKSEKRPSLSEIEKRIRDLTPEEFEKMKQEKEFSELAKNIKDYFQKSYINVSDKDVLFLVVAKSFNYTFEEIDKYLHLGLFVENPYCENDYKEFKVFDVIGQSFVLAQNCKNEYGDKCSTIGSSIFVFFQEKGEVYFDDKILSLGKKECVTITGTLSYLTSGGRKRTVPIVDFELKFIDKGRLQWITERRTLPPLDLDNENSIAQWKKFNEKWGNN